MYVTSIRMFTSTGGQQLATAAIADMADANLGTKRYSLFIQVLNTHCEVCDLYTTEWHVCIYWTPPRDSHVATFAARWWERKRRADGNLRCSMMAIIDCKLPSSWRFFSPPSSCKSHDIWIKWRCSVNSNMLSCHIQIPKPGMCAQCSTLTVAR